MVPCIKIQYTKMTNKMQQCRIIYCSLAALHVSSDTFAHHREHLNCITASDIIHVSCCLPFSWESWNWVPTLPWILPATTHVYNTKSCKYSLDAPDDERKYRSKHVEQPRNNKLSYTVASCWSFSYTMSTLHCLIHLYTYRGTQPYFFRIILLIPNPRSAKSHILVFICCIPPVQRRQLTVLTSNNELIKFVLSPFALFLRAADDNYVYYNVVDVLLLLVLLLNDRSFSCDSFRTEGTPRILKYSGNVERKHKLRTQREINRGMGGVGLRQ
jgi:hypothetical protein